MLVSSSKEIPPKLGPNPIRNVDLATFMVDVIEASREKLVIVDFWAEWCSPCKQLGPILEKFVRLQNEAVPGSIFLAKVDIDKNQQIAQQMGVQSIPAVFAFSQGRPVDGFMGALPEAQVKAWIEQMLKTTGTPNLAADLASAVKQGHEFFEANDLVTAEAIYREVLEQDANNAEAYAGVLRCLLKAGDIEKVKAMLATVPSVIAKDKLLDSIHAAIELSEQTAHISPLAELKAKVDANPLDHQSRFDLGMAHYAAGAREEAVEQMLEIVSRDRKWNDDGARKQLIKFFEAFGVMDPVTIAARKRLSSLLFS